MVSVAKDFSIDRYLSARQIGIFIFLLAFAMRFVFVHQWHALPYGDVPLWDAKGHDDWAQKILQGQFLQDTAFYSSPLYPYVLALIYKVFGHIFMVVSVINALMDSLTCMLLGTIAFECFGAGAAIMTGLLAAFCRSMIFYTAPVMKESLGLFLLAAFTLLFLRALRHGGTRDYLLGGFCLGLCALVRGNVLIVAPVVVAVLFWRRRSLSTPRKYAIFFLLSTLLAITPATLHNFIASRDFVLINYDDGFNLYLGNSPWATGISYDFPPFITADPRPEEIVETHVARQATGNQEMSPSAVSAYWRQEALSYVADNPVHSVALLGTKFLAFWNTDPQFDNYDISFIQRNFSTLLSLPLVSLWLIVPLATFSAIGLWSLRRRDEFIILLALAAAYMTSVLLFYVTERYRLPVIIFLLPLAGAAVPTGVRLVHAGGGRRPVIAASVGAILMLGLTVWPRPGSDLSAYDWGTLGGIEADRGRYDSALQMIQKGVALAPQEVGADAMIKASYADEQLGHADQAAQWLAQARQLYPDNGAIVYNIGRLYAARGQLTEALSSFRQAISLTPTYTLSYYAEAVVEERLGQHDEASASARRGLEIAPDDSRLQDVMEQIRGRRGAGH